MATATVNDQGNYDHDANDSRGHGRFPGPSLKRARTEEHYNTDELDLLPSNSRHFSALNQRRTSSSATVTVEPNTDQSPGLLGIGRAGLNVLKSFASGSSRSIASGSDSNAVQDALETAAQAQAELRYLSEEHTKLQAKFKMQEEQVQALRAAEEENHRLQVEVQALQTERAYLMDRYSRRSADCKWARGRMETLMREKEGLAQKYEARIECLLYEKGNLNSQLKQHQTLAKGGSGGGAISLDPFDNTVDQVSESAVKSGVESLNESLDNVVLTVLDEAEELANQRSSSRFDDVVQQYDTGVAPKFIQALVEYSDVEEKRGFLLEAILHHMLLVELDQLFFSGDVVPQIMDTKVFTDKLLEDLTKREPWTVAQRWRSLTAASGGRVMASAFKEQKDSITGSAESTVVFLAWVYRQPLETFEPLNSKIQTRLSSIYDEAQKLAIMVRRDLLSVRMSVVCPKLNNTYPPYNPESMSGVWPDMGPMAGDEVLGLYHFGLKKQTEIAEVSYLIKPEVTTEALLREMAIVR
ncbi:hypothetical protein GGX14DRAFT_634623 [Mycena pura]|uniref:Uncharacterized protein n=1 Tax=Mycena pura TaxID=153505 RepID=A0AAD6YBU7_9AGAR|nr:hypothetical protein GGX14DRAFT_634623 [Mycena pura]